VGFGPPPLGTHAMNKGENSMNAINAFAIFFVVCFIVLNLNELIKRIFFIGE